MLTAVESVNGSGEWRVENKGKKEFFDFEKLVAYQKSLDFVDSVFTLCDGIPASLQSSVGDQLRRAALSIVNNIAEGSGQRTPQLRRRYYETAWNSARECIPMFNLLNRRGLLTEEKHGIYRSMCAESCRLISGLLKSLE